MLNLLVVDDEPHILRGIVKTLSDGFSRTMRILSTDQPAEALKIAEEWTIHILITDMLMPEISGGELIERITALYPSCKSVLLTNYKNFDVIYKFANNQNVTYLLKIEDEAVLLDTVRRYIDQYTDPLDFQGEILFTSTNDELIQSIENYVVTHVTDELNVGQLAGLLGLHAAYLSRYYKSGTGRNISAFISHVKMEKAKQLLRENRLTINEISALLRFDGASYFITFFKKHSGGVTPKQYRIAESPVTAGKGTPPERPAAAAQSSGGGSRPSD